MYSSIWIEGPQEDIDNISALINKRRFKLDDLDPVPDRVSAIKWKKNNWGISDISDVYLNIHHSATAAVKAAVMIGFEANGNALKWLTRVAKRFPKTEIVYEIEETEKDDFIMLASFSNGERTRSYATLF